MLQSLPHGLRNSGEILQLGKAGRDVIGWGIHNRILPPCCDRQKMRQSIHLLRLQNQIHNVGSHAVTADLPQGVGDRTGKPACHLAILGEQHPGVRADGGVMRIDLPNDVDFVGAFGGIDHGANIAGRRGHIGRFKIVIDGVPALIYHFMEDIPRATGRHGVRADRACWQWPG